MQQIERVGVVALLFLVVTIVVVAFWDDGRSDQHDRVAQRDARAAAPAREEEPARPSRDDGRVPAQRNRERLAAPVSNDRAEEGPMRVAGGRRAHPDEQRATDERDDLADPRAAGHATPEPLRAPRQAEEERMVGQGLALADESPRREPEARRAEPASRKAKPEAAPAPGVTPGVYVVKSGDSLERIARRELGDGSRWKEILQLNGLTDPRRIVPGQKLNLPGAAVADLREPAAVTPAPRKEEVPPAEPPARSTTPAPAAGGGEYVVQAGDTLSQIALKTLGTSKRWREIAELNPKIDPNRLFVGAKLALPGGGATPAKTEARRDTKRAQAPDRLAAADSKEPGFRVR